MSRPDVDATLVDITCDSEGKVSSFTDVGDIRNTIRLHDLKSQRALLPWRLLSRCLPRYNGHEKDLHTTCLVV